MILFVRLGWELISFEFCDVGLWLIGGFKFVKLYFIIGNMVMVFWFMVLVGEGGLVVWGIGCLILIGILVEFIFLNFFLKWLY